jgi:hypothetical protein
LVQRFGYLRDVLEYVAERVRIQVYQLRPSFEASDFAFYCAAVNLADRTKALQKDNFGGQFSEQLDVKPVEWLSFSLGLSDFAIDFVTREIRA